MKPSVCGAILLIAAVTYLLRALPLTLIRGTIRSRFIRSFLHYVPVVTLTLMTFPTILTATRSPVSGLAALIAAVILAFRGCKLFLYISVVFYTYLRFGKYRFVIRLCRIERFQYLIIQLRTTQKLRKPCSFVDW